MLKRQPIVYAPFVIITTQDVDILVLAIAGDPSAAVYFSGGRGGDVLQGARPLKRTPESSPHHKKGFDPFNQ